MTTVRLSISYSTIIKIFYFYILIRLKICFINSSLALNSSSKCENKIAVFYTNYLLIYEIKIEKLKKAIKTFCNSSPTPNDIQLSFI